MVSGKRLAVRGVVDDVGGAVGTERQALAPVGEHAEVVVVGVVLHHQDDDVPDLRQQVGALGKIRARPVAHLRRGDAAPRRLPCRRRTAASDLAALEPVPHPVLPPAPTIWIGAGRRCQVPRGDLRYIPAYPQAVRQTGGRASTAAPSSYAGQDARQQAGDSVGADWQPHGHLVGRTPRAPRRPGRPALARCHDDDTTSGGNPARVTPPFEAGESCHVHRGPDFRAGHPGPQVSMAGPMTQLGRVSRSSPSSLL